MSDQRNGGIVWCEQTWNPIRGCSRVSAGCVNCYAEAMAVRFAGPGQPYEGTINPDTKRWNGKIRLVPDKLADPLRWQRPRMVFVNSMSDLFHEDVPFQFIADVFAVMSCTTRHTYQVLTKRPARMLEFFAWLNEDLDGFGHPTRVDSLRVWPQWTPAKGKTGGYDNCGPAWPLENVWLGVTAENQPAYDERVELLRQTPAAVRWISVEPMLGEIAADLRGIDWVVCGGESGPNARPMHPDWARSLRDQCAAAGVPFLFKQWGEFGTIYENGSSGSSVFKAFSDFQTWVNKASTWVRGGICLGTDGRELKNGGDMMRARDEGKFPVTIMHRVGKKSAGRLLDGVPHDGYPEVKP